MSTLVIMNECVIKALTLDSRRVKPGDLFMAVRGLTVDGRDYIENAIQNGAVAVLVEHPYKEVIVNTKAGNGKIPIIPVSHLRELVGHIAARFFLEPSKNMPVIGITGTNGKTSISHFIAQIFSYCGKSCGVMGSLGTGFIDALDEFQGLNTADAITVQKTLSALRNKGANLVTMEVTSHGLDQNRVEGVQFHTTIFTNLTQDHLDYHKDMQHYAGTKRKLFTDFQSKYSIINLDDEFGQSLVMDEELYQPGRQVIGYTTFDKVSSFEKQIQKGLVFITTHNLVLDETGIHAFIRTPWGEGKLECPLLGHFNLSNILAALAVTCIQGVPLLHCLEAIRSIKTVKGRMMRFGGKKGAPLVVIDYAHTPDALAKILESVRQHCQGKVWCVFGCGGDRDRGKRPLMTAIAETLSDHLCLTQDNPRTEDPKQIFNDMLQGLKEQKKIMIEPNRAKAIELTLQAATADDVVVIAGKGHEEYQIIGTQKIPFSDLLVVETLLARRGT